ncbi:hypothetical protein HanXRQr2_Chr02g0081721 [Helianthus annuus]|uniref:Uncharacterized protein n=1 Tax=Helianthus annuus TaxID=4232 RepID=A0A9K3JRA9_HELAN|nr:hypothetical protein HanXRQr2_Chr02g0081721 [Helianthus annuus]KAJ0953018.1 hypothetical protein HanPSC8_Chr02g0079121 [Helianthus annuus]
MQVGSVMVVMEQWKTITDPLISVFSKSLADPSVFSSVRFFLLIWFFCTPLTKSMHI